MKQNNSDKKGPSKEAKGFLDINHLKRFGIVSGITVGTIGVFAGAGYLLDQKLGTTPWLLIVGVIISFPLTQYLLYRKMKQLADKEIHQ